MRVAGWIRTGRPASFALALVLELGSRAHARAATPIPVTAAPVGAAQASPAALVKATTAAPAQAATAVATTAPVPARAAATLGPPGVGTRLPWHGQASAAKGAPRLLWTGFRSLPGGRGAEVWLQTSAAVEVEILPDPEGAVLRLKDCRNVERRTDGLPLETRYFASAVSRVTVARHGRHLDVRVTLKAPGTPTSRQETGPDGSRFWVFSFGPAQPRSPTASASASASL
jgi:hypothetical protein